MFVFVLSDLKKKKKRILCYQHWRKWSILSFNLKFFKVIDDKKIQRRICVSTWQTARNKKCLCVLQIRLCTSWEHINVNLANITNTLFGTKYVETVKLKVSSKVLQWMAALLWNANYCHFCFFSFRFIQTVGYEVCISQTDFTLMKSCRVIVRWTFQKTAKQHPAWI